ncbi:AAA family ATPase [Pseudomonas fluorescens]|uniref:AAA family ATPase n=1 Tax=Pseudomonas fluorescens TaxID=294 RepID=UPI0009C0D639|nr:AAA family ATPase [Pseudomonas fluorescens]
MTRITEFYVEHLYGLYNHQIDLDHPDGISILHGPNGVGKTAVLKCISYIFSSNFEDLIKIPFNKVSITLSNAMRILVTQLKVTSSNGGGKESLPTGKLEVIIFSNEKLLVRHTFNTISQNRSNLSRFYSNIAASAHAASAVETYRSYLESKSYVESHPDLDVSDEFLLDDKGIVLQENVKTRKRSGSKAVKDILNAFPVHFVETNRLYRSTIEPSPNANIGVIGVKSSKMTPTVHECARDLVAHINSALKSYGANAQKLDQSFPHRFISESQPPMDIDELKVKFSETVNKLRDLRAIGLLEAESVQPFDIKSFDAIDFNKLEIMSLFVRDSQLKLTVFDSLLARTQLLLGSMEKKFRNKRVLLSKARGLYVKLDSGDELPLESLSSGEQHELVLMYELLFKVPSGTLVLIDEPELSLHVSWQKAFLPELISVAKEVGFSAVVATHSPFIVGGRHDLMSALDAELDDE